MLNKFRKYILENNLIHRGDYIVLGVSGGADSVCLFLMLKELSAEMNLKLMVVHINHGIRGEEALQDADFVENLCRTNNIQFRGYEFNIPLISKEKNISIEEAGREIRYETFVKVMEEISADSIAVAHNENDSVETVLLSLFRGTGIKGLTGIQPVRGKIIRPLLCMKRKEIEQYLEEKNASYRNDSTNSQYIYARNRIRNIIIPEIRNINEAAEDNILVTARQLQEIEEFLQKITLENYSGSDMLISDLKKLDVVIQRRIIRKAIEDVSGRLKDVTFTNIKDVLSLLDKEVGKTIHLPYDLIAIKKYDSILIKKRVDKDESQHIMFEIKVPGEFCLANNQGRLQVSVFKREEIGEIEEKIYTKFLDYDKIKDTLYLRNRINGDYFKINREGNTKKIKSYFIDEKIPLKERDKILLIAQGNHVLWIIGHRISEEFKVTETTQNIIKFEYDRGKDEK